MLKCFHQLWATARWIWGLSDDKEIRIASWGTIGKNKTKQNKNNQNQKQKTLFSTPMIGQECHFEGQRIKQIILN